MNLFRRAITATTVALALSGGAALTGIGAPAAEAVTVTGGHGHVVVELSSAETKVAASLVLASAICTFEILPRVGGHVPIDLGACGTSIHECSRAAGQRSHPVAVVTFYHGRSSCTTQ